jgi:hypothetical protein
MKDEEAHLSPLARYSGRGAGGEGVMKMTQGMKAAMTE